MKIEQIKAREILDSRGNPTVEVEMKANALKASACAPSGASTGSFEAVELRDGGKRFQGKGVLKAVRNVNSVIAPKSRGKDFKEFRDFDRFMIELDGTQNKKRIGANATTAASLCFAKLLAASKGKELYDIVGMRGRFRSPEAKYLALNARKPRLPIPFSNIINGGKHAGNKLAIQEFMIVPIGKRFDDSVRMIAETYHELKALLKDKYGPGAINVGDEGGFAPALEHTGEALALIHGAIEKAGYEKEVRLAIDSACDSFYKDGNYYIDGKVKTAGEMVDFYMELVKTFRLFSIEDPFFETDFQSFAELLSKVRGKARIVGDDLTVTNPERVKKAMAMKSMDTLLLKVNQIGTLSEALEAAEHVYKNNGDVIVSHRSGETEDAWLADVAVGIGAMGIKLGAPARSERVAKYNRLLRIGEKLGFGNYAGKMF